MKWWSSMSTVPIPHSNGYKSVDIKDHCDFRIELKDFSVIGDDIQRTQKQGNNFFKQLEKGISVEEEVEQFLSCDTKNRGLSFSRINASKRCREVLNYFLLKTFKDGLKYVTLCNLVWFIYLMTKPRQAACLGIVILLTLITGAVLIISCFKVYHTHQAKITTAYACVLCVASLSQFTIRWSYAEPTLYTSCCTVLVLLYTILPMSETLSLVIALSYSLLFELCYYLVRSDRDTNLINLKTVITRVILQVISHALGIYVTQQFQAHSECLIYNMTRLAMAKEKLRRERKLKERVISSVMPASIGNKLVKMEQALFQGVHIFRPMVMHYLNNVSILFADIVGFTKMSSNLKAIEIVHILNTICYYFDRLTTEAGCTKISTLGDCYYCVAGCPQKMLNHAPAIVGLGLKQLNAIEEINNEIEPNISIRIGIHTGSVLCGVVGIKRFRFDVWSHDVLTANEMESTGLPGKVHISEATYCLTKEKFLMTDGQAHSRHSFMEGVKTYFVVDHQETTQPKSQSQPQSRKSRGRSLFKLRFHSSSEGHSSLKSFDDHVMKLKSFSMTSNDMISPTAGEPMQDTVVDDNFTSFRKPRTSFSEAICTDRKVTDTEVMSQIVHTPSAFQSRSNLNFITLHFHDPAKENMYRDSNVPNYSDNTISERKFKISGSSLLTDVLMSVLYLTCVGVVILLSLPQHIYWLASLIASLILEVVILGVLILYMKVISRKPRLSFCGFRTQRVLPWLPRNIISSILVILPFVVISIRVVFGLEAGACRDIDIILFLYISAFLHGINFLQVSGLLKIGILLLLVCLLSPFLYFTEPFSFCYHGSLRIAVCNNTTNPTSPVTYLTSPTTNLTSPTSNLTTTTSCSMYQQWDVPISLFLLFVLISLVIRTFELRIRLNFSSSVDAKKDQELHKKLRDQAYWLLENLIPSHVLVELKKSGVYHRDHSDVGVCFASIVNFQDFFDAKWKHGHDSIRILNELISDIDDILDKPKYSKHIEKIKTALGCTYMAASGLVHEDPSHIFVMMDFLFDIKKVLAQFNKYTMGFEFQMKYGCHVGPVASGVIGQSAPMFDIWGDTVNLASRMMSTGVVGKIQVLKETVDVISSRYMCIERGDVYVKGKGNIITYFVVNKIPPLC